MTPICARYLQREVRDTRLHTTAACNKNKQEDAINAASPWRKRRKFIISRT